MANLDFTATFPGGASGLTLETPAHDVWDWDYSLVSSWDTDVTAGTEAALETAISNAMALGTTASPQYHRITWTGGTISSAMTLTTGASLPDKYGPHILIDGGSYTSVTAEIAIQNISNCMFTGFRFERSASYTQNCIMLEGGNANGKRIGFSENQIGRGWSGGAYSTWVRFLNHANGTYGWEIQIRNNDIHNLFELASVRIGKTAVKHNFARGMRDDFIFMLGLGYGGENYVYSLGNVICDHEDNSGDLSFHPDYIQAADNNDGASDEYHIQSQGNIFIGSTWQQYPTQAFIVQAQGAARVFRVRTYDDILLTTGDRGIYLIDEDFQVARTMFARPPLGGPLPWGRSPQGWRDTTPLAGPLIKTKNWHLTSGTLSIGDYLAGSNAVDNNSWGNLVDPSILAIPTDESGANCYTTVFPAMAGEVVWTGSPHQASAKTPIIDAGWSSVTRSRAAIRTWVSDTYEPYTVANGTGWAANGFVDPATWFA